MATFNLKNAVERNGRIANKIKCAISELGDNSALELLLQQILDSLKKQDELTRIKFCEDGVVTGYVIKVWDEESNTFGTDIYLNESGSISSIAPTGSICSGQDVCDEKGSVGTVMSWNVIK